MTVLPALQLLSCFLLFMSVNRQCVCAQDDEEIPKIGKNIFASIVILTGQRLLLLMLPAISR